MKLFKLQNLLGLSFLFAAVSVRADEIGPSTCGHVIEIHGQVNHYSLGADYQVTNATDNSMYIQEIYGNSFEAVVKELPAGRSTHHEHRKFAYLASGKKSAEGIQICLGRIPRFSRLGEIQ